MSYNWMKWLRYTALPEPGQPQYWSFLLSFQQHWRNSSHRPWSAGPRRTTFRTQTSSRWCSTSSGGSMTASGSCCRPWGGPTASARPLWVTPSICWLPWARSAASSVSGWARKRSCSWSTGLGRPFTVKCKPVRRASRGKLAYLALWMSQNQIMYHLWVPPPAGNPCGITSLSHQSPLITWEARLPANPSEGILPEEVERGLGENSYLAWIWWK